MQRKCYHVMGTLVLNLDESTNEKVSKVVMLIQIDLITASRSDLN